MNTVKSLDLPFMDPFGLVLFDSKSSVAEKAFSDAIESPDRLDGKVGLNPNDCEPGLVVPFRTAGAEVIVKLATITGASGTDGISTLFVRSERRRDAELFIMARRV
jgi:hypothetical protein